MWTKQGRTHFRRAGDHRGAIGRLAVAAAVAALTCWDKSSTQALPNTTETIENTGQTLTLDDTTGSLVLYSGSGPDVPIGTIRGGTVVTSGGARVELGMFRGRLDGVTLAGEAVVQQNAWGLIRNGLMLSNGRIVIGQDEGSDTAETYLWFEGTQMLGGAGEVVFNGPSLISC